jgi:hypothetical protein
LFQGAERREYRGAVGRGPVHADLAEPVQRRVERSAEHLALDHEVHRTGREADDQRAVEESRVISGQDDGSGGRDVLPAVQPDPPERPQHERPDPARPHRAAGIDAVACRGGGAHQRPA